MSDAPNSFYTTGTVKWFDRRKGFGFIVPDDGLEDVLLPVARLEADGFKEYPMEGARVEFAAKRSSKGICAASVHSMKGPLAPLYDRSPPHVKGETSQTTAARYAVANTVCRMAHPHGCPCAGARPCKKSLAAADVALNEVRSVGPREG